MRLPSPFRPVRENRNRYLSLLAWLVAYLLADAVALQFGRGMRLMDMLFLGVLFATIRALSRSRAELAVAASIGVLGFAAAMLAVLDPAGPWVALRFLLGAAFGGFMSGVILREVLQADTVNRDTILGAVTAYLFVGICWAGIYGFVEHLRPGSLALPAADHGTGPVALRGETLLYFSFVTLATLGYGDIVPVTPLTRALAWIEAVFGQFYIAVLVARLVGLVALRSPGGPGTDTGDGDPTP